MDTRARATEYCKAQIPRLVSLIGADEGMFVLACDSFLEGLAVVLDRNTRGLEFKEKTDMLRYALHPLILDEKRLNRSLKNFGTNRWVTNDIRHEFKQLFKEDALAATQRLLDLLQSLDVSDVDYSVFSSELDKYWHAKKSPVEFHNELRAQVILANTLRNEKESLLQKVEAFQDAQEQLQQVQAEKQRLESEYNRVRQKYDESDKRIDKLRQELHEATERERKMAGNLEQSEDVRAYMEYLARFTSYTRSRQDYERSVLKLSAEQQRAVDLIKETGDYLIKGPAGTGKTLVVMHAVQKELDRSREELGLTDERAVGVFTFTKSLARFNRYLAHVLGSDTPDAVIKHVDSVYQQELTGLGYHIRYSRNNEFERELIGSYSLPFLPLDQLVLEVNDFIFGNDLSEEDYVEQHVPRRGLKQPLSRNQREQVWAVSRQVVEEMERTKAVTKFYGVGLLKRKAKEDPAFRERLLMRRVFIDEAQDLTAVELQFMKQISANGVVVVGDQQQMIYRLGGSYLQAGIDIRGKTQILKVNYRNTDQICRLSEIYRGLDGEVDDNDLGMGEAFRIGPAPELFTADSTKALYENVARRIEFFLSQLNYEPENLAIIAPTNGILEAMAKFLTRNGVKSCLVNDKKFDFETSEGVRLSTMHSAKGLEFPVVFLVVPKLPGNTDIAQTQAIKQQRNLIYVSLTRAMDNLQIFTLNDPEEFALKDIAAAFELMEEET
jgi:hypothetical protein